MESVNMVIQKNIIRTSTINARASNLVPVSHVYYSARWRYQYIKGHNTGSNSILTVISDKNIVTSPFFDSYYNRNVNGIFFWVCLYLWNVH